MKLYHGRYILPALAAFLLVATMPVWRGLAARGTGFQSPPNPQGERCIEPKSFMRAQHMRLLIRWRDEVVRENRRVYTATDGRAWEKSLKTCVACHGHMDSQGRSTTAAAACNECHNYVNAKLDCWNCHHDSKSEVASPKSGDRTNGANEMNMTAPSYWSHSSHLSHLRTSDFGLRTWPSPFAQEAP